MNEYLDRLIAGNSLRSWGLAISMVACAFLLLAIFKKVIFRRVKQWAINTKTRFDVFIMTALEKNIFTYLFFLAVYGGLSYLTFSESITQVINIAILTIGTFFIIRTVTSFITYTILNFAAAKEDNGNKRKEVRGITIIASIGIWIIGLLFLIDNLGYDITTVIAGLGIGGIAIALAAQTVLGDLFSYFVIFF